MDLGTLIRQTVAAAEGTALLLGARYTFPLHPFVTPVCRTQFFLLLVYTFFCSSNNYFFQE